MKVFISLLCILFSFSFAQKANGQELKFLLILKTDAEWTFDKELGITPTIQWIAHNATSESWWLIHAKSWNEMQKIQSAISKAVEVDNQTELFQVHEIGDVNLAKGDTIQTLRYHFLEYGIKMIDPADDGSSFRDRLNSHIENTQWLVSDQFEGFMLAQMDDPKQLKNAVNNDPQIRNLKLSVQIDSMQIIYIDKN
ncbi:hypothetical protein ACFCT7_00625 [Fulvivirgaceae bacterium LMO-SS25]